MRVRPPDDQVQIGEKEKIDELSGKLAFENVDDKLMRSVLDNDKEVIDKAKLIAESFNRGIGSFTPDILYEQLVKNYRMAKEIYGEKLIRQLTGYSADYVERNVRIPEFKKILKERICANIALLKDDDLIDREGIVTDKGLELASLILYTEELDNIIPKGIFGEVVHKENFIYGDRDESRDFRHGDRYKDIALKSSIKVAIRRGHTDLSKEDLRVVTRKAKGKINIIYALDASGSMKGRKVEVAKKAGIALAYKAIDRKDAVGLIVFGTDIRTQIEPCEDFTRLLKEIAGIRAGAQTNIPKTIARAAEMFPSDGTTKHLIILTDAMPTTGEEPEKETIEAASAARSSDVTISVVGIDLTKSATKLASKIAEIGEGRLYIVKNLEELDRIVLEDYYGVE